MVILIAIKTNLYPLLERHRQGNKTTILKQNKMRTIKRELADYLLGLINEEVLTNENVNDWHYHAFNEDYYIIGYHKASEWLKWHDLDVFDAIRICQEYEKENFGESLIYNNSEETVNMLAYIIGEELLNELHADTVEELEENINEYLNN